MDSTMLSSALIRDRGDDYGRVYQIAFEKMNPVALDGNTYAVAILSHDKDVTTCVPTDFIWFKVKATHTIAKLKSAYRKRTQVAVQIRYGQTIPEDTTEVQQFAQSSERFILFTTHQTNAPPLTPSSSTTAPPIRTPLQPVQTQISAGPVHKTEDVKPTVKPDPENSSNSWRIPIASPEIVRVKTERVVPPSLMTSATQLEMVSFKPEPVQEDTTMDVNAPEDIKKAQSERLQKLIEDGTPDQLEGEVRDMRILLESMRKPMASIVSEHRDAKHWVQQIDSLLKHKVDTPTVIGVVGNTGAGKSSVINALLEEERLVPTNCMRACTAVVTEMSWNPSDKPSSRYRAEIEFIKAEDWEKDLRLSFSELLDSNGQVSRECNNEESEAGVAYAKLKSVYPSKTKEMLADATIEQLLNEPAVKRVLGTTMTIEKPKSDLFYKALQNVIDSKEKKKGEKKEMEYWPLIKVVKLYTKAEALSTGAIIVDLPGVHDSNAARAAVAAGYMKQCTGLFIVAPINRAVDDKAAKSLLGESFKRQLKFDGTYSRITFICSKTDDISITEASDSLGLDDQMAEDWEKIDEIDKQIRELKRSIADIKESRAVYQEIMDNCEDKIDVWEDLRGEVEAGEKVWAPEDSKKRKSKKRKKPALAKNSRKKAKPSTDSDEDFIDGGSDEEQSDGDDDKSDSETESEKGEPLTLEEAEEKISKFREDKKKARGQKLEVGSKLKTINKDVFVLEEQRSEIEAKMSAVCIEGRNNYSRGAIQRDFADGIRELDMENAQEEDPDQFDPEDQLRDYDEVAKSLPVFCVSSRAYQKLAGRLTRDAKVSGFRAAEETEIPQLQAHCKKLTEGGRAANCRAFLTNFSQLLTSLNLWASNDGSGVNLTDAQLAVETRYLKTRLNALEKSLQLSVKNCLAELNHALAEHIFDNFDEVVDLAKHAAPQTCKKWHGPVNRDDRSAGGYFWATYKAIMRREGVFSNAQGPHDFNASLAEPIIKNLASHWERVFAQRLPRVLQSFSRQSKTHLSAFHQEIEARGAKLGLGVAGLALLGQQLRNYEGIFVTLSSQMLDVINELQREANREFTPVICRRLQSAYEWCAAESGGGQFIRMKNHMEGHIDQNREAMFRESVDEVKRRLDQMCEEVEDSMTARSDEVYTMMSRDYLGVMGGSQLGEGEVMPRWERKMRAEVFECIETRDNIIADAKKVMLEAKLAEERRVAEEEQLEAEHKATEEKRIKNDEKAQKERKREEDETARKKKEEEEAAESGLVTEEDAMEVD